MAITPDPRQCWLALPEPVLRFAVIGPAPSPEPVPEFGSAAYWSASDALQRASWVAHNTEFDSMLADSMVRLAVGRAA